MRTQSSLGHVRACPRTAARAPRTPCSCPNARPRLNAADTARYADAVGIIDNCPDCPYLDGKAVGARGDPASRIVIVGEAPGADEVVSGQQFTGRAGADVLWPAVRDAGLHEADVYVANSVACRPYNPARPADRKPSAAAISACHGRLVVDLDLHQRVVVVALGATAVQALTGLRAYPVTKETGAVLPSPWGPVIPTLHPAYVLRHGLAGQERERLVADLIRARRMAEEVR